MLWLALRTNWAVRARRSARTRAAPHPRRPPAPRRLPAPPLTRAVLTRTAPRPQAGDGGGQGPRRRPPPARARRRPHPPGGASRRWARTTARRRRIRRRAPRPTRHRPPTPAEARRAAAPGGGGARVDSGGGWLRKLIRMTRGCRGRRIGAAARARARPWARRVGAVWSAAPAPVASAQQDLIDSDPAVVKARADLEAAQLAAHEAEAKLEATTEQKAQVEADIAEHQQRIAELDQQRAALAQLRDTLLDHLRKRAVALYATGGDGTGAADIFSGSVLDGARRKQLGDAASRSDHDNAKKLEAARAQLGQTQDTLRAEQDDLQHQQTSLEGLLTDLQQQQAAVDQRVAEANAALERARAIGALHAANDPIMGPNTLTADQMLAWFDAQGYRPRLGDTSVGRAGADVPGRGRRRRGAGRLRLRPGDRRDGRVLGRARPQLLGARLVRHLRPRHRVPDPARRHPRPDPAAAQLRRRRLAVGQPAQPAVAVLVGSRTPPTRSTTTSPRAGRPPGATWATATGPPTPTTPARSSASTTPMVAFSQGGSDASYVVERFHDEVGGGVEVGAVDLGRTFALGGGVEAEAALVEHPQTRVAEQQEPDAAGEEHRGNRRSSRAARPTRPRSRRPARRWECRRRSSSRRSTAPGRDSARRRSPAPRSGTRPWRRPGPGRCRRDRGGRSRTPAPARR